MGSHRNYEKAGRATLLLSGAKALDEKTAHDYRGIEYPDDCIVDFDMRLIDLFREIGREFLALIETTDMQKVYKIPILYSFYHDGDIRLAVKDGEVLAAWKKFFDNGTNWKDFSPDITYDDYKAMTDGQHLSKARSMPIRFLRASGKGFFIEKAGCAIAIREDLRPVIGNAAFKAHMKDILEYRTMEYYRRRYEK